MRILYISYAKDSSGGRVHTEQFYSAIKSIYNDIMIYPPLTGKGQNAGNRDKQKSQSKQCVFRELRMLAGGFTKNLFAEAKQLSNSDPDVGILRAGRYVSSLVLFRLLKIPSILEVNGPALENRFLGKNRLRGLPFWEWMEKRVTLRLPTHLTVVSEPLKQYYISRGIPPKKITTVPNGVDTQRFHPGVDGQMVREKLGTAGKTVLGFSGAFAPWHGIDFLLETVENLIKKNPEMGEDIVLLLIGKPGPSFTMPDLPRGYIVTTGYVPYDNMPSYLAAVDVFIAPYPRIEPFYFSPLKIFEAMAMGKPVLASAQGQICELITDGVSGLLYQPGEMTSLLHKLGLVINDNELRRRLGSAAREKIVRNYTWENNAQAVLNLCQQLKRENS
jgi:glycosyltransferase involved in cell wall biosynthesis